MNELLIIIVGFFIAVFILYIVGILIVLTLKGLQLFMDWIDF